MTAMPTEAPPPLLLVAASGLAREAAEAAVAAGREVLGCLDDDPARQGRSVGGLPVIGTSAAVVDHPDAELVVCVGKGSGRARVVERLTALGVGEDRWATVVAPSVRIPPTCTVGRGSVLLDGTVLTTQVTVGRHVVCMPGVVLTHDDVVEDYATLCAGVVLGGTVRVGRAAYLGMAVSVRENLTIGAGCVVGMGAVVLADVPAGETWAGVPAARLGGSADDGW